MELLYFKSDKGNFGDDINPWIWTKLFDFSKIREDYFLGIGSLLHPENKHLIKILDKTKVVFGTGVRPSKNYKNLHIDENWKISFLRGPLSSYSLGNKFEYISDAAYAIRHIENINNLLVHPKKYKVSFMPYFHSVEYFDWKSICSKLGYNYISPLSELGVEHTLNEIAASESLITEAMHGAIFADILRVPWHKYVVSTPYTEGERISDFKWMDWLYSINVLNIETTYVPLYTKTRFHPIVKTLTNKRISMDFFLKSRVEEKMLTEFAKPIDFYLSSDNLLSQIDDRIEAKIRILKETII